MAYKIPNFHNVSIRQTYKAKLINANLQAKVWVNEEKGKSKDTKFKIVNSKMKKKYPEIPERKRKELILNNI